MKITELLDLRSIDLNPQVSSKEEAIDHMVDLLDQSGKLNNKEVYKESVLKGKHKVPLGLVMVLLFLMDKVKEFKLQG